MSKQQVRLTPVVILSVKFDTTWNSNILRRIPATVYEIEQTRFTL
mgnify:CR=1 FL=1